MRSVRLLAAWGVLAATAAVAGEPPVETLQGVRYRAVTLDPGQRRVFKVPGLERLTASSGTCLEEELAEEETIAVDPKCAGVRTSLLWLQGGQRIHLMACAEDEGREPALVKARQKVQADLRAFKGATACIRYKRIELLGWVLTPEEKAKVAQVAKKHGADDKVEKVEPEP